MTITKIENRYEKTSSGKNWKNKPYYTETETVTEEHYNNYVDSVPFFNNFGYGAYCRAYYGYCKAGYKPLIIVTVNPGRTEKIITRFDFQ